MSKSKWQEAFEREAQSFPEERWNAKKLTEHMEVYLQKKASDTESEAETWETRLSKAFEALKSLVPGFVVQPPLGTEP